MIHFEMDRKYTSLVDFGMNLDGGVMQPQDLFNKT